MNRNWFMFFVVEKGACDAAVCSLYLVTLIFMTSQVSFPNGQNPASQIFHYSERCLYVWF